MRRPNGRRKRLIAQTELRRRGASSCAGARDAQVTGGGLGIVVYSLAIGVMAPLSAAPSPAATPRRLDRDDGGHRRAARTRRLLHTPAYGEIGRRTGRCRRSTDDGALRGRGGRAARRRGRSSVARGQHRVLALVSGLAVGDAGVLVAVVALVGSVAVTLLGTVLGFSLGLVYWSRTARPSSRGIERASGLPSRSS